MQYIFTLGVLYWLSKFVGAVLLTALLAVALFLSPFLWKLWRKTSSNAKRDTLLALALAAFVVLLVFVLFPLQDLAHVVYENTFSSNDESPVWGLLLAWVPVVLLVFAIRAIRPKSKNTRGVFLLVPAAFCWALLAAAGNFYTG